jgi:hypothetical protein
MYKITVIGAILVATIAASVFKDKMAVKNLHSRASFSTQEAVAEDSIAQKNRLVLELMQCYDSNHDGALNTTEFDRYVTDGLSGRESGCFSDVTRPPFELTSSQNDALLEWTSGTKLFL